MVKKITSRWPTSLAVVALAVVYFCSGKFGLSLAFVNASASAVWPPTGIALAALLLWGYRLWPGIFLGAFLVNITTQGTPATTLGIALGNTLEALLGAWLVCRFANGLKAFERAKTIFKFVLLAAILSTVVSATLGVTSLCLGGFAQWDQYWTIWVTWFLGDMVGDLIVAPLLVIWITQPLLRLKSKQALEGAGLLLTVVLIGEIVFLGETPFDDKKAPLGYLALLPLLWAAFRFGHLGAVTSAFLTSIIALWGTLHDFGPFVRPSPNESLLFLQAFMGTITMTALVLASVVSERKRAEQRLQVQDAVSRVLAESPTLRKATPRVIQALCEMAGWEVGSLWNVDRTANELSCVEVWHIPSLEVAKFEASTRQHRFAPGIGLPGRVWSSGQPMWIPDVTQDSNFPRAPVAIKEGLHAAFCFPFKLGDEILGVIECFSREIREPDDHFLQMLPAIGSQLGQFVERRRAEEARQHSEALKGAILESALDCIISMDQEGQIIEFNPAAEKTFGYTRSEALGKPLAELLIPPRLREHHYRGLERYLAMGEGAVLGQRVEMPALRADGTEFPVELSINAVQLGGDRIFTGYLRDITRRKQAYEALRESKERFQAILDNSTTVIYLKDLEGRYILINARYEELFHISKQEIIGKTDVDIFPERLAQKFRENDLKVIETGVPVEFEEVALHRDGAHTYISIKFPLRDTAGKTYGVAGISTDITERKRAEEQIRKLNAELQRRIEEFQTLIDTAPVGIGVAADSECRNIWGNREFARILGTDVQENISKSRSDADNLPFKVFHDGHEVPAEDLPMQRACREGIEILGREFEIIRTDGTIIHELCSATPLRDEHGGVRGCIGIVLDITDRKRTEAALEQVRQQLIQTNQELERAVRERSADLEQAKAVLLSDLEAQKKLEEQLRQAQKLESIGTLAGGVAHDFNNILNIIRGYAGLLESERSNDLELRQILKVVDESIDRGASVVQQLLAIARKSETNFERVHLNELLERTQNLLKGTFPKTIEIASSLEPGLPPITADPNQIDQVILNICLNARDAMPGGGRLLLSSATVSSVELRDRFQEAKNEQYACISVIDTGRGMDEAVKSRIFEPFFTTKSQGEGTGLGLSVAYGIIMKHGGFIDVASRPMEGTKFFIYLPIAETVSQARKREHPLRPNIPDSSARAFTILFVEDEDRQLELMRRFLEGQGHRVLVARDGLEAVESFIRHKDEISAVVLDLGLPKLTGWEAYQKMKEADPTLKPIFATGYLSPEVESAMAKGELSALILKPYLLGDVLEKISEAATAKFSPAHEVSSNGEQDRLGPADLARKPTA